MCGGAKQPPCTEAKTAPSGPRGDHPNPVHTYQFCFLAWRGIPDPLRRVVARTAGLSTKGVKGGLLGLPGCGCTVVGDFFARGLERSGNPALRWAGSALDRSAHGASWAISFPIGILIALGWWRMNDRTRIMLYLATKAAGAARNLQPPPPPSNTKHPMMKPIMERRARHIRQAYGLPEKPHAAPAATTPPPIPSPNGLPKANTATAPAAGQNAPD